MGCILQKLKTYTACVTKRLCRDMETELYYSTNDEIYFFIHYTN